ncbi:MAG: Methyltransferase type 11 [archaeon GW2011_AR20]|nr:MAG: Methyltransferase type 11 [archaeon GW2011_AR20]MBS3160472.1 methyltransferase domain-containing protein [Candidatus Woesearchaeota archaeon]
MKILDLGCGNKKYKSKDNVVVGVDNVKLKNVDIAHDLNKFPYPFKKNEFDLIYTSHALEHLDNLDDVFQELIRITKPGGRILIRVPHFSCGVSYRDPTHKRLFSYFTFDYFTDECFYTKSKFKIIIRRLNFTRQNFTFLNYIFNPIINLSPLLYERFFCWILPCAEVIAELEVRK